MKNSKAKICFANQLNAESYNNYLKRDLEDLEICWKYFAMIRKTSQFGIWL